MPQLFFFLAGEIFFSNRNFPEKKRQDLVVILKNKIQRGELKHYPRSENETI